MRYMPLAMRMYRFYLYYMMERDFGAFYSETGGKTRDEQKRVQIDYIRRTAPERYRDALIPHTEIGCKRKVLDTDYLACLHRDNMELVYDDPVELITETGVVTKSGREVPADAVILANGFKTQQLLHPLVIRGENGITLNEHVCQLSLSYTGNCSSQGYNSGRSSHPAPHRLTMAPVFRSSLIYSSSWDRIQRLDTCQ